MNEEYGYGLWVLVVLNSVIFIVLAASFFHPRSNRDWRVLGGFSAFVIALFTEMYGYPLTVYLLSGPLGGLVPGVDLSHDAGHLWTDLIGWKGDPHFSPFHLASYGFIIGGFWVIASGWKVLFAAIKTGELATTGPYARLRHPQNPLHLIAGINELRMAFWVAGSKHFAALCHPHRPIRETVSRVIRADDQP